MSAGGNEEHKIFVGSLPGNLQESDLRNAFSSFGDITEIALKPNTGNQGGQWAFLKFAQGSSASAAVQACHNLITFDGAPKPSEVKFAHTRSGGRAGMAYAPASGGFANGAAYSQPGYQQFVASPPQQFAQPAQQARFNDRFNNGDAARVFIGNIPGGSLKENVQSELQKFGHPLLNMTLKDDAKNAGRMWAIINFADEGAANRFVSECSGGLLLEGCGESLCEVKFANSARNMMYAELPAQMPAPMLMNAGRSSIGSFNEGRKIFVGSIPEGTSEEILRQTFGAYGDVEEVAMKPSTGGQQCFAFITFYDAVGAQAACQLNGILALCEGQERLCEVRIARQQGTMPQGNLNHLMAPAQRTAYGSPQQSTGITMGMGVAPPRAQQSIPGTANAWTIHDAPGGKLFYHNEASGVTQWDTPAELVASGQQVLQQLRSCATSGAMSVPAAQQALQRFLNEIQGVGPVAAPPSKAQKYSPY